MKQERITISNLPFDISGLNLDPSHVGPKIRWFADTHTDLYGKARYFLLQAMGVALEHIRAVGGGARSPLWRQIKASVTGLPVALLDTVETTALGAGLLALAGKGYTGTLAEAVERSVHVIESRLPDPINTERYQAYYQIYRLTYFSLQPVFEQASRISP